MRELAGVESGLLRRVGNAAELAGSVLGVEHDGFKVLDNQLEGNLPVAAGVNHGFAERGDAFLGLLALCLHVLERFESGAEAGGDTEAS